MASSLDNLFMQIIDTEKKAQHQRTIIKNSNVLYYRSLTLRRCHVRLDMFCYV